MVLHYFYRYRCSHSPPPHPLSPPASTTSTGGAQAQPGGASSSSNTTPEGSASEADRVEAILRAADVRATAILPKIVTGQAISGPMLGLDMLGLLCDVLYGVKDPKEAGKARYNHVDTMYFLLAVVDKISDIFRHTQLLVDLLESNARGRPSQDTSIEDFTELVGETMGWDKAAKARFFPKASQIYWYALCFGQIEATDATFQGKIRTYFNISPKRTPVSFTLNLKDIEKADLTIMPTTLLHEHLQLEGDSVKVFALSDDGLFMLHDYHNNRAAKVSGLEDYGLEVKRTLHTLYGKDQLYGLARDLNILKLRTAVGEAFTPTALALNQKSGFTVLASRIRLLNKEINYRRSRFPSLMRDIKKQIEMQPFLFYGAILAIFFGVCTLIQTVVSVWSLVLAIWA
ncbi:hypothetical protein BJ138DRAFT_1165260 [Hygrophoropsis aurantiaca]|uniref:Uncharacterized protein n=1 Tax=Hygrophoropsis aurantiaca TaxID=72124 RepID=A0ACB7ZVS9_9AGAM|nr:hypothetical protein BJ138DRAFT_1165260 [Hygrophoropsis aurantiaca]